MTTTTKLTTITYDDYLRLRGLMTLAKDHNKALGAIVYSARKIVGEGDHVRYEGHAADEIYGYDQDADALLRRLDITVLEEQEQRA